MDYTPTPPPKPPEQKPEYVLVDDVTHKPKVTRGPQTIKDIKGNEFQVPHLPNPKCKKCLGRGYIAFDTKTNLPVVCKKCYPGAGIR